MGVDRTTNLSVLALASLVTLVGMAVVAAGATLLVQFASGTMIVQDMVMWVAIGIVLIGLIIAMTALIAQEASNNFADTAGRCTGKFRLSITAIAVFVAMCITGYVTYRLYTYQHLMSDQYDALQAVAEATNSDDTTTIVAAQVANVTMSSLEHTLAEYFDYIFSEAVYNCDVNSDWFWYWVDNHCPSEIHRSMCMQCPSYSLTFCGADPLECQSNIYDLTPFESNAHVSCAYSICRSDIVHFMQIYPFGYGMYVTGGLTVLYLCLWIAAIVLLSCTRVVDKQHVQVVPMKDDDGDSDDDSVDGVLPPPGSGPPGAPGQLTVEVHPVTDHDLMLGGGPETGGSFGPPAEQKRDDGYDLPSPYPPMYLPSHQHQHQHQQSSTNAPPLVYHHAPPSHQPYDGPHMGHQQVSPSYPSIDNYSPNEAASMPTFVYDASRGLPAATGGTSHRGLPAGVNGGHPGAATAAIASRVTDDEQHQLALALALSQQTAAVDQHQPNRQRFHSRDEPLGSTSVPPGAVTPAASIPTLTREQEDLQLAIALSASTAAQAAASSKATSGHNRSHQNLIGSSYGPPPLPQPSPTHRPTMGRRDDDSVMEDDELQLALALSLSAAAANQK